MKRFLLIALSVVLISTLFLTGCGTTTVNDDNSAGDNSAIGNKLVRQEIGEKLSDALSDEEQAKYIVDIEAWDKLNRDLGINNDTIKDYVRFNQYGNVELITQYDVTFEGEVLENIKTDLAGSREEFAAAISLVKEKLVGIIKSDDVYIIDYCVNGDGEIIFVMDSTEEN